MLHPVELNLRGVFCEKRFFCKMISPLIVALAWPFGAFSATGCLFVTSGNKQNYLVD
jgi:hypothetical protein